MKILVACEYSGIVSEAFAAAGHYVMSCDLLPSSFPNHYQGSVFDILYSQAWDMLIAFPPCTYLCKAQFHLCFKSPGRYAMSLEAAEFIHKLYYSGIPKIAIENPIGLLPKIWRNYDQLVYSDWFGDPHRKDICLWLKNLPPLIATKYNVLRKPVRNHVNGQMNQALKSKIKSKFFPMVAEAMAKQWSYL